ncbi:MAG: hypothetical protein H6621_10600 [Halobacteriovoraceae bacterium]|nr:hypothetical protein [Halobacteriovoraceae bacterium]MCB9095506.1 hypothetical protein [Halobacteriovoraceae bacterium]
MIRNGILIFLFVISLTKSYGTHFSLGYHKMDPNVQSQDGSEASDPYSPTISLGHNFNAFWGMQFSPQIGYIKNKVNSGDSYGGDYKIETYYLLYDLLWNPFESSVSDSTEWVLRTGLGTYQKSIKGSGGTVTVPNGTSTTTAYRPSGSSKSYTTTLNLGIDGRFNYNSQYIKKWGLRLESFLYSPFQKQKRTFAYLITLVGYF